MKLDYRGYEEFEECDSCRVKPGSPMLCALCLSNRRAVGERNQARRCAIQRCYEFRKPDHGYCQAHYLSTLAKRCG